MTSSSPVARHQSRYYDLPPGSMFTLVALNKSAIYSCELDPTTSFCLYTPPSHPIHAHFKGQSFEPPKEQFPLVVLVHHAGLNGQTMRDDWSEWALKNNCVLLSVIFPYIFREKAIAQGWKTIIDPTPTDPHRYDLALLSMVETAGREWGYIDTERFGLAGYSAGGQFCHRFLYLHPERVKAVTIGAPGTTTLLSPLPWPLGIADTSSIFGITVQPAIIKRTKIHVVIGSEDVGGREPGARRRPEILKEMTDSWEAEGVPYEMEVVEGAGHAGLQMILPHQQAFLEKYLRSGECCLGG